MMAENEYVTNDAWVRSIGRPDAIDDVADQFERPVSASAGPESFWSRQQDSWPTGSRGWRSRQWMNPRPIERRAG
jgi:hypothetical protein